MLSREWVGAVFQAAGLPVDLCVGIARLLERHLTYLSFAGHVFAVVEYWAGFGQGNPLSVIIYILCVDPFLRAAACIDGVRAVWGFCDDWNISIASLNAIGPLTNLVRDFELASGQVLNRTKTAWMPNRPLGDEELQALERAWPQPKIVDKHKSLGVRLGPAATLSDNVQDPLSKVRRRLSNFSQHRMSLATRITAVNVFVLPLLSYVFKFFYVGGEVLQIVRANVLHFLCRMRWCSFDVFCHLKSLFKCSCELRDPFADNIASLIATCLRLQAGGLLVGELLRDWLADIRHRGTDPSNNEGALLLPAARPLLNFQAAYVAFYSLTHVCVTRVLSQRATRRHHAADRQTEFHTVAYQQLHRSCIQHAEEQVRNRLQQRGLSWDAVSSNVRRMPSTTLTSTNLLFCEGC